MFQVGDKVVYPMHGAGVIEAIEEREVLGARRTYYVMCLPLGELRIMIPTHVAAEAGLRQVVDADLLQEVFTTLRDCGNREQPAWNRRYRTHLEKMRSGDILEVAEVVRNLSERERDKGLSGGERKMLENARQILLSEIIMAKNLEATEAVELLDQVLAL